MRTVTVDTIVDKLTSNKPQLSKAEFTKVRAMLFLWGGTTTFMWFYSLYTFLAFENDIVVYLGLTFTILHSLTPYIFYLTQSLIISGLTISLTGLAFQVAFGVHSGGVFSPVMIWLSFHPVILAFFGNNKLIFFSVVLNAFIIMALYFIGLTGLLPPNTLPQSFHDGMLITSFIGLDILIAVFTIWAIKVNEEKTQEIKGNKELIENLVRVLCHDLSNPIMVAKMSGRMLESFEKQDSPNIKKNLSRVNRAIEQIEAITTSVRTWTAVRDSKMILALAPMTSKEVCDHLIFTFQDRLNDKKIDLIVDDPSKGELIFLADKTAFLYQVVNNLFSNALKYSCTGSKIILRFEKQGNKLRISIIDHGVGIDLSKLDDLFSPFKQSSTLGTENEKGTGFGLPIVKTLIQEMNGEIEVYNHKNQDSQSLLGTEFCLVLDLIHP